MTDPRPESVRVVLDPLARPQAVAAQGRPGPISQLLFERLSPSDVEATIALFDEPTRQRWDETQSEFDLVLAVGCYHRVGTVLERSGLRADEPPPEVHAMARGVLTTGGTYYYADAVAAALQQVGAPLADDQSILDFGCSSGRVARVLAAAFPRASVIGCDPNQGAIQWAGTHLGDIGTFFRSTENPPLPLADASLDLVYALSVWSHFGEFAAIRWFEEMRRILKPGGHLLFSTHGWHTLRWAGRTGGLDPARMEQFAQSLYRDGLYYFDSFGEAGDWGVKSVDWGWAAYTAEWLLPTLAGNWEPRLFLPGAIEDNQDLWVLRAQ